MYNSEEIKGLLEQSYIDAQKEADKIYDATIDKIKAILQKELPKGYYVSVDTDGNLAIFTDKDTKVTDYHATNLCNILTYLVYPSDIRVYYDSRGIIVPEKKGGLAKDLRLDGYIVGEG